MADRKNKKPTLKTIAQMTGLGITTVSKALKEAPDLKKSTIERVKRIARQVGYQPDRAGQRLRTGKTNIISLVLHTEDEFSDMLPVFLTGVYDALEGTSYSLELTPYRFNENPMKPVRDVIDAGGADGMILSRIELNDQRVAYLQNAGLPFATHGRSDMGIEHPFYDFDCTEFARLAVHQLAELGCSNATLISPPAHFAFARFMQSGYSTGLRNTGLGSHTMAKVTLDDSIETIAGYVAEVLTGNDRPDGFVCSSVKSAIATIAGIERVGLVVGKDANIVAKQSTGNMLKWFGREIYDIEEDFKAAGYGVTKCLLHVINGDAVADHQKVVFPDQWGRSVLR